MNATSKSNGGHGGSDAVNQFKLALAGFWAMRNARERSMLGAAVAIVALGLVYALLIDPALSGRVQANKNLPLLRQQVATMQALSQEAAALSGKAAVRVPPMTKQNVEAGLQRKGLSAQNVVLTGEFAKVQMASTSFGGLIDWLDDAQKTARLSVVEASITALPAVGMVDANITLRQQKSE